MIVCQRKKNFLFSISLRRFRILRLLIVMDNFIFKKIPTNNNIPICMPIANQGALLNYFYLGSLPGAYTHF